MTYETCSHAALDHQSSSSGKLMPIACIVAVVALLVWGETKAPVPSQSDSAASVSEDWHGNVRRSHWGK